MTPSHSGIRTKEQKSPRLLPIFLLRKKLFIGLVLAIFFSLTSRPCICHRLVSRSFQSVQVERLRISQGQAWGTKASDSEIGTTSCSVVLLTSQRTIPMPQSCCSRPGTRSPGSYPTLFDTASILQIGPYKVDPFGSISCTRHPAFITFLRVILRSSCLPNTPKLNCNMNDT